MRSGEIKSLRWFNVALDSSMLSVGRAKTRKGTGRQIPINADMVTMLEEHARWYRRKMGEIKQESYVLPGRAGKPVNGQQRPLIPRSPLATLRAPGMSLLVYSQAQSAEVLRHVRRASFLERFQAKKAKQRRG
jgi:integrase